MSYKQFIQELEDDVLPAEAECRYRLEMNCLNRCINKIVFVPEKNIPTMLLLVFFFFFCYADIKNTSPSIFQLKNELILTYIRMRNGNSQL